MNSLPCLGVNSTLYYKRHVLAKLALDEMIARLYFRIFPREEIIKKNLTLLMPKIPCPVLANSADLDQLASEEAS